MGGCRRGPQAVAARAPARPPHRAPRSRPLRRPAAAGHARPAARGPGHRPRQPLFTDITGHPASQARNLRHRGGQPPAAADAGPDPRRLRMAMSGDAARRSTWRPGRYSPCPRDDAGRYLAFLASLGYQLSAIEQAVADGAAYTGDTPARRSPDRPCRDRPCRLQSRRRAAACGRAAPGRRARPRRRARDRPGDPHR